MTNVPYDYYRLDENKNAIPCTKREWENQREEMRKNDSIHVARDKINNKWISTVWLGLNHNFIDEDDNRPHIFETMILDEEKDEWMNYEERYSTWAEAEEGHKKALQWVKDGCKED